MANDTEKEAERDVQVLLIRAAEIAEQVADDLQAHALKFSASDIVEIAKLLQVEEMRHVNQRSVIDPTTGKWVKQKS